MKTIGLYLGTYLIEAVLAFLISGYLLWRNSKKGNGSEQSSSTNFIDFSFHFIALALGNLIIASLIFYLPIFIALGYLVPLDAYLEIYVVFYFSLLILAYVPVIITNFLKDIFQTIFSLDINIGPQYTSAKELLGEIQRSFPRIVSNHQAQIDEKKEITQNEAGNTTTFWDMTIVQAYKVGREKLGSFIKSIDKADVLAVIYFILWTIFWLIKLLVFGLVKLLDWAIKIVVKSIKIIFHLAQPSIYFYWGKFITVLIVILVGIILLLPQLKNVTQILGAFAYDGSVDRLSIKVMVDQVIAFFASNFPTFFSSVWFYYYLLGLAIIFSIDMIILNYLFGKRTIDFTSKRD